MKKLLILFFCMSLYMPVSATTAPYNILNDLNTYRQSHQLLPLLKNEVLCKLATTRVKEIQTDWSHDQFQKEIDTLPSMDGIFYENLAKTLAPQEVVLAWSMSQAGHNEAMLIKEMKYGCIIQHGDYYAFEGYIPAK